MRFLLQLIKTVYLFELNREIVVITLIEETSRNVI